MRAVGAYHEKEQAMNHQTSKLTDAELDSVRGSDIDGYHYCSVGPAGTGLYPNYVPCGNPFWNAVVEGAIKGASGGGSPK